MLKTILIPQNTQLTINLPQEYIGKEIEIIAFYKNEGLVEQKLNPKKSMADFSGILSENDYQSLKTHTEQARNEWNRDI